MCFLVVYRLFKSIRLDEVARILESLGYSVRVRNGVVEGYLGDRVVKARVRERFLDIKTSDYGEECLFDLRDIDRELYRRGYKPRIVVFSSPYLALLEEDKRGSEWLLRRLGVRRKKREYIGPCG